MTRAFGDRLRTKTINELKTFKAQHQSWTYSKLDSGDLSIIALVQEHTQIQSAAIVEDVLSVHSVFVESAGSSVHSLIASPRSTVTTHGSQDMLSGYAAQLATQMPQVHKTVAADVP